MNIIEEKKRLRGESAVRRNLFNEDNITITSLENLYRSIWFQQARTVALYISQPFEFPTKKLFEACVRENKIVYAPVIQQRSLTFHRVTSLNQLLPGEKGISEPIFGPEIAPRLIDVFFVPLVAFDRSGNRLGRGAGYFDRLFSDQSIRGLKIGVGFDAQEFYSVPTEEHDVSMDYILTERRILKTL